jgi:hypothetical protein
MKLEKKFENAKAKTTGNSYRIRRFTCTICGYSEMVTADGAYDRFTERQAIQEAKKLIKQQQENERL